MRILHICLGAVRKAAHNGGQLRAWQNLASLVALGHEVHLVIYEAFGYDVELEPDVRELPAAVHYVIGPAAGLTRFNSWQALVSNQAALRFHLKYPDQTRERLHRLVSQIQPDLIWAEWVGTMALLPKGFPVVYSHQDFFHKIVTVRRATRGQTPRWPDRLRHRRLRLAELDLCAQADHVACVSDSERAQIATQGQRCSYIPICGPTVASPPRAADRKARVFFFGNWGNTAMRSAARHCREAIWPLFAAAPPGVEWHQVGDPERIPSENWRFVEKHFVCHGYVEDLTSVFRLGDASLAAYQQDTGFRTKFVTAAAHGVVSIGYPQTFRCAPEFTAGRDCLVAGSPSDVVDLLVAYGRDADLRRRLGEAARALYERAFSFEAQLPKYERVLEDALSTAGARR